jgi:hypothetical protein
VSKIAEFVTGISIDDPLYFMPKLRYADISRIALNGDALEYLQKFGISVSFKQNPFKILPKDEEYIEVVVDGSHGNKKYNIYETLLLSLWVVLDAKGKGEPKPEDVLEAAIVRLMELDGDNIYVYPSVNYVITEL